MYTASIMYVYIHIEYSIDVPYRYTVYPYTVDLYVFTVF